jgi:hypothetical protein
MFGHAMRKKSTSTISANAISSSVMWPCYPDGYRGKPTAGALIDWRKLIASQARLLAELAGAAPET